MSPFDPARLPRELPVLGVHGTVLFPGATAPLALHTDQAVEAAHDAVAADGLLAVALRRTPPRDDDPFHRIAALASVRDLLGRGEVRCRVVGLARVELVEVWPWERHARARVTLVEDAPEPAAPPAPSTRDRRLRERLLVDGPDAFPELPLPALRALVRVEDRSRLADLVLAHLDVAAAEKQRGLAERSVELRLALASSLLDRALAEGAARRQLVDHAVRGVRLLLWRAWRPRLA
jgi:ATP-dependent Lon protease